MHRKTLAGLFLIKLQILSATSYFEEHLQTTASLHFLFLFTSVSGESNNTLILADLLLSEGKLTISF